MSNDVLQDEHPEKNGWWINELESLGIDTKSNPNELKDKQDNSDLVEAINQTFIEEYKQTGRVNLTINYNSKYNNNEYQEGLLEVASSITETDPEP